MKPALMDTRAWLMVNILFRENTIAAIKDWRAAGDLQTSVRQAVAHLARLIRHVSRAPITCDCDECTALCRMCMAHVPDSTWVDVMLNGDTSSETIH